MDSRLSSGLRLWLSLPGWLLLLSQGLGIGTLALLGGGWLLQDEWRQRESTAEQQQRLLQQIAMVQSQLEETRIDYVGLLVLLEALPADLRLEQLSVETPPLGMTARLVLQDVSEDQPDE